MLLTKGVYEIKQTLTIGASGVVVRGEGAGREGTVLLDTRVAPLEPGKIQEATTVAFKASSGLQGQAFADLTDAFVPVGATTVHASKVQGLSPGQPVIVVSTPSAKWFDDLGMASVWTDPTKLVQRAYSRNARHSFIMNGPRGGNVFFDSFSTRGHNAQEPHQVWQHGSLYDNVRSDSTFRLNRVDDSPHGQRAVNSVL